LSCTNSKRTLGSFMNTQTAKAIPDKLFFKIGEVCDLVGVQAHVLRYWESEFPTLQPQKNRAGQRTYRRKDVEMALRIKELLYDEGFTIAGAKRKLAGEGRGSARLKIVPPNASSAESLASDSESAYAASPAASSVTNSGNEIAHGQPGSDESLTRHPAEPSPSSRGRISNRESIRRLRLLLEEMLVTLNRDIGN
jgi:DNA-binding transcriptional MerR regulator